MTTTFFKKHNIDSLWNKGLLFPIYALEENKKKRLLNRLNYACEKYAENKIKEQGCNIWTVHLAESEIAEREYEILARGYVHEVIAFCRMVERGE